MAAGSRSLFDMSSKKSPSFAQAFAELESITGWFEREDLDLDEGLKKFERALELADLCKKKLSDTQQRVREIKKRFSSDT